VVVVGLLHARDGLVAFAEQPHEARAAALAHVELVRGLLVDDEHACAASLHFELRSARRRSASSVFTSAITPARAAASATSSVTKRTRASASTGEPSSVGTPRCAGSTSATRKKIFSPITPGESATGGPSGANAAGG